MGNRLLDLPPVIGHRGAAARAPENTLAGFRTAKALGCAWVEFDVRLTADRALVVCHDDTLVRTTDCKGRISALPLEAVRRCDAGGRFDAAFAGERVPTLSEALGLCHELGLGANVEIKAEPGHAQATAAAVAVCLGRPDDGRPPVLISSFLRDAVVAAAQCMPHIPRAMLWRKLPRDWAATAARLGCATVNASHERLDATLAGEVRGAGYPLLAYTVNDAARARQLFRWGVASVFSDAPDIIRAALAEDATDTRKGAFL